MLADLLVNDEEGAAWLREDLAKLNGVLTKAGLAAHEEPTETDTLSIATYGYSGLHYLRRCAAFLEFTRKLPKPWRPDDRPSDDPLYERYAVEFENDNAGAQPGTFARESARQFDHLFMHSDAEGYYIPQRFDRVLIAGDQAYGWVGSSYALAEECERLAAALELPSQLLANGEDFEFENAIVEASKVNRRSWSLFATTPRVAAWRQHPVASMMCAKLHTMAIHSIRTGAVLVFC